MNTKSANCVLVIVPGSFSEPDLYYTVRDELEHHGVEVAIVKTPSVGRRDPQPPATLADDAAAVRDVTKKLAEEGKTVVLVAHSYGGMPATQSLQGTAKVQGKQGGVSKIVFLSALVVDVGVSCIGFMGQLPEFLTVHDDYITADPGPNSKLTFSDLPEEEALKWANQMPVHSTASFKDELSFAGYNDVDVGYIVLEDDMIIPVSYQEMMIQFLEKEKGKSVDVYRLKSGHCPNASKPKELAEILRQIAVKT